MVSGFDVAKQMLDYLNGNASLEAFREWLLCAHIDAANQEGKSPDQMDAARLLMEIEARYAEHSDGVLNEQQLRMSLARLLAPRAQSAESALLTYFYSVPLQPSSEPSADSSNGSQVVNYQPTELAAVA